MGALLAWLGKIVGTLLGGPGIAVLGDPGVPLGDPESPDEAAAESDVPPWMGRLAGVLVVLAVLAFFGAPWQMLGALGVLGLIFVFRPRYLPL
jgi:hypothetical protein